MVMSELIIVQRPKFLLIPDAFVDRFEDEIFYAYEAIAQDNLKHHGDEECLPMLEQFDDNLDMKAFLDMITSFDMFGDEDYEGFLSSTETAEIFYEMVGENIMEYVNDTRLVLNHYKMSLATSDEVFNSPIREVW
jgi:hypothetical protein